MAVLLGWLGPPTITTQKKSFNYGAKTPSVRVHVQKEKGPSSGGTMQHTRPRNLSGIWLLTTQRALQKPRQHATAA